MKSILCFGDSNTYGLVPGTNNRYEWGTRWSSILDERVRDKGYRVVEEGLCGRTTIFEDPLRDGRRGTELLPTILESHKPVDMVVLMLGTNDCKTVYDASAEVIGKGIEKLISQIKAVDSDIKILLMSPINLGKNVGEEGYDPEFDDNSVEVSKKLPKVYKRIANDNCIDFLAASEYASPSEDDREHLNVLGHRKLADAVYNKVEKMIS